MSAYNHPTSSSSTMASSSAYQTPTYIFLLSAQNLSLHGESLTRSSPSPHFTYRAEILKPLIGKTVSNSWQDANQGQLTLEQAARLRKGAKRAGGRGMGKKKDMRSGLERNGVGVGGSGMAPEPTQKEKEEMWREFEIWRAEQDRSGK